MIEREIVKQKLINFKLEEEIKSFLNGVGYSHLDIQKTPLGEKITVYASRPGLVVGRGGKNIKELTQILKTKFFLENPQLEVAEVKDAFLDANIVSEYITSSFERFGVKRFKGIVHKAMTRILKSGAMGCEIRITGKVPSARARSWFFYKGYMKKSGHYAQTRVNKSIVFSKLKPGIVGVKVSILPQITLPDNVTVFDEVRKTNDKVDIQEDKKQKSNKRKSKPKKETKETKETKPTKEIKETKETKEVKKDPKNEVGAKSGKETQKKEISKKEVTTEKVKSNESKNIDKNKEVKETKKEIISNQEKSKPTKETKETKEIKKDPKKEVEAKPKKETKSNTKKGSEKKESEVKTSKTKKKE